MSVKKEEFDWGIKYIYDTLLERTDLVVEATEQGKNAYIYEKIENKELYVLNTNAVWNDGNPYIDKDYDEKQIQAKKQELYKECTDKAIKFIDDDNTFQADNGGYFTITDNERNKLQGYYIMLEEGETISWCDKKEQMLQLNKQDIKSIILKQQELQTDIWTTQYNNFYQQITDAKTLEELDKINIQYSVEVEVAKPTKRKTKVH